jgi:hypothetical protein
MLLPTMDPRRRGRLTGSREQGRVTVTETGQGSLFLLVDTGGYTTPDVHVGCSAGTG